VANGDQAWRKFNDEEKDAPKEIIGSIKDVARTFRYVHTLTPLNDKSLTLSPLGEVNVNDKAAVGVKVACKDLREIHVFLDKATALPLKAELKLMDEHGKELNLELSFSDYKEFDGRKHFTKVDAKQDGTPVLEVEFSDFRWVQKLEASLFEQP
jgi:hypothetical protein